MEITYSEASEALDELLVGDFTLAEAAEAEALVDAASAELATATTIHDTDIFVPQGDCSSLGSKDDESHTYTELGIDAHVGNPADFANLLSVRDDWNSSAAEKRASGDAELREDVAWMASAGVDWWGAISQTGFGPTACVDAGRSGESLELDGSEVVVTYEPVDADEVREAAGMRKAGAVEYRGTVGGMYRDFLQAASVSTPELDDLFTDQGYSWDNLSEAEAENKALRIEAWWV